MTRGGSGERLWLRPLGLLAIALALAVGRPLVLVAVPFALLAFLAPGQRATGLLLGAAAFALVFAGAPDSGFWYVERGWAVLVGGWFAALSVAWPGRPFLTRALFAVGGGTAWAAAILLVMDGWRPMTWLVEQRIEASAAATLELARLVSAGGRESGLGETLSRTAEVQGVLFPALLALSTLAALGVAWWLYIRVATGSGGGLAPLRSFRFPDAMIWVLIGGLVLVMLAGWSGGWGRLGANLVVFMGGLYALRGAAVLLFMAGGVSLLSGALVAVGMVLAAPVLLAAAMAVGMGDSWLDLRARKREAWNDSRQ